MSSSSSTVGDEQDNLPPDPIPSAIQKIRQILGQPGKMAGTDGKANQIKLNLQVIENDYLKLQARVRELEAINNDLSAKCINLTRPHQLVTAIPDSSATKVTTQISPKQARTYSAVASQVFTQNRFDPLSTLQVFPNLIPETNEPCLKSPRATQEFVSRIKTKGKKVGIVKIKDIHSNGVSILCRNREEVQILKEIIDNEQKDKLRTNIPVKRNPTFTMLLTGKGYSLEEVQEDLIVKNDELTDNDPTGVKLVHKSETRNGNTIISMQVTGKVYQQLRNSDFKIYYGMQRVSLREQEPILQCFNCFRFGHKSTNCRLQDSGQPASRCRQCAKSFLKGSKCPWHGTNTSVCCANCSTHNNYNKQGTTPKLDTGHAATDSKCQLRQKAIQKAKLLINYD